MSEWLSHSELENRINSIKEKLRWHLIVGLSSLDVFLGVVVVTQVGLWFFGLTKTSKGKRKGEEGTKEAVEGQNFVGRRLFGKPVYY